jgi:hypothetical protein
MYYRFLLNISLIILFAGCSGDRKSSEHAKTFIKKSNGKYQLYRNGKPYLIKGAAGYTHLEALAEAGGNTIRIWDTTNLLAILQNARKNNIAVIVGLPIHLSSYLSFYNDPAQVAKQFKEAKALVNQYKNEPALLMWCVGNELHFPYRLKFNKFYKAFNQIVDMIHTDDPDHPVTTTMIDFQPSQIFNLRLRTNIDLISFNIFGGIGSLQRELKIFKWLWRGPYLITEWGINGPWGDDAPTAWGAFLEPSSTIKAKLYLERYQQKMPVNDPRFLGSFIFYWGQKQETTHTWFSLFDEYGYKTESVSTAQYLWKGKWPQQDAPKIKDFSINKKNAYDNIMLQPGEQVLAEVFLEKQDSTINRIQWEIYPEDWYKKDNINNIVRPQVITKCIDDSFQLKAHFTIPKQEGPYRLFVNIYNKNGYTANVNIPFYVLEKAK